MSLRPCLAVVFVLACGPTPELRHVLGVSLDRGPNALHVTATLIVGRCADDAGPYAVKVNGLEATTRAGAWVVPPKPWFGPAPSPYCMPWAFDADVPIADLGDTLQIEVMGPGTWKATGVLASPLLRQVALAPPAGSDPGAMNLKFVPGPAPTKVRAYTNSASEFGPFDTPCAASATPDTDVLQLRCARRADGQPDGPTMWVAYDAVLPFTCEQVTCATDTVTFAWQQVLSVQLTRPPLRTWTRVTSGTGDSLMSVWGTSRSDIWAVGGKSTSASGTSGTILHFDGTAWSAMPGAGDAVLWGVWAASPSDAWAVGPMGLALHWNGAQWTKVPTGTTAQLTAIWGSSASNVWAVGFGGLTLHWDGGSWTQVPSMTQGVLERISGVGPNDIWAVGEGNGAKTQHWDGTAWTTVPMGDDAFRAVFAASATEVWLGNNFGVRHAITPNKGCCPQCCAGNFLGLWGTGPSDVWAVGFDGPIRHYDGDFWTAVDAGGKTQLRAVWGSGPDDVWAVGDQGQVLHFGP